MIGFFYAVFDTNVLVSAMLSPRGNEARAISLWHAGRIGIALSNEVLSEYQAVSMKSKFGFGKDLVDEFLEPFQGYRPRVIPGRRISISPHEPDNRILECAEAANAAYLITGNLRHFPATHGVTRILNARAFLEVFEAAS